MSILFYTKLAADLLRELKAIQDDDRIGEDNYQRLIEAVLQVFHAVEQVTVQVMTNENKSSDSSEPLEETGLVS